jgi:hypothetical protein
MTGIVGLLLDEAMPPARLGALLADARRRSGLGLVAAAREAGCSMLALRAVERGRRPCPPELCLRLAEVYGDLLVVPDRVGPVVGGGRLTLGLESVPAPGDPDELLATYAELLTRLRGATPGTPIPLRADDLEALAATTGRDAGDVEQRIVELLGCSVEEARELHGAMLRRKLVVPIAGIAVSAATFTGIAVAAAANGDGSAPAAPRDERVAERVVAEREGAPSADDAPDTKVAPQSSTGTESAAPADDEPDDVSPSTTVAPTGSETTSTITSPPAQGDGKIGIPPGETYVEIGDAIQMAPGDDAPHAP